MLTHFPHPINPHPPDERGDSTLPRPRPGNPGAKAGTNAAQARIGRAQAVSRWLRITQVKACPKRRHTELAKADCQARPKMGMVSEEEGYTVFLRSSRTRPGVKRHPTATQNDLPEQGNPAAALCVRRCAEQVASRTPPREKIVQEAKARGNARDRLTWTRTMRG